MAGLLGHIKKDEIPEVMAGLGLTPQPHEVSFNLICERKNQFEHLISSADWDKLVKGCERG